MSDTPALGFIGLGVMGEPICRNMLKAHAGTMTVFDLNPEPVSRLAADGAGVADSVAEIAAADIVFLSLPGGPEVEATVLGADGLLAHGRAGQTIVDLSTCPVGLTRSIAENLADAGLDFADAPVARTRQAANRRHAEHHGRRLGRGVRAHRAAPGGWRPATSPIAAISAPDRWSS